MSRKKELSFTPRVLRQKDAPAYLGMSERIFNKDIRPHLTEIPIGKRGVGFDRVEIDEFFDIYKEQNGHPGKKGGSLWLEKERRDFSSEENIGGSSKPFAELKSKSQPNVKPLRMPKKSCPKGSKKFVRQSFSGNGPKERLMKELFDISRNRTMRGKIS